MTYRSGEISLINPVEKFLKAATYGGTAVHRASTKSIINSILIGLQIWFCRSLTFSTNQFNFTL